MSIVWRAAGLLVVVALAASAHAGGTSTADLSREGGGIAFTFGSGWASGLDAAQMLESHGMRGTFYVVSGQLRDGPHYAAYLSASEVADLSRRGHEIASMTATQADLTGVDASRLEAELAGSRAALASITGGPIHHLAYPYGAVDDEVARAAAGHYGSGRAISWAVADFVGSVDAFRLPGFIVRQATSLAEAMWIVDQAKERDVDVVLSFERITQSPGVYDWTPEDLDALAAYVERQGVAVPTISEIVERTGSAGTVVFTFDDGATSHLAAADTLAARGFRGTFYIVSDCEASPVSRDRCLRDAQVRALSDAGHDIASHTVRHPDLSVLEPDVVARELADAKRDLEAVTGKPVEHVAYPYGAHTASVRSLAERSYATGRIYLPDPAPEDLPRLLAQSGSDPMVVPGIGVTSATTLERAKAYVDFAASSGSTIVLVFHDVASPGYDAYSWTPTDLATLADHVQATGVSVKTMAQAYADRD